MLGKTKVHYLDYNRLSLVSVLIPRKAIKKAISERTLALTRPKPRQKMGDKYFDMRGVK